MSKLSITLSQPERLHFPTDDGEVYFGCDQEWFRTPWQRMAGCGPTVAATQILYLHKALGLPLSHSVENKTDCVRLLESMWKHVTPGFKGVHLIEQLSDGVLAFAQKQNVALDAHLLQVPRDAGERPSLEAIVAFMSEGLRRDCPVAFLNLSNGKLHNLDEWHWVTLVALEIDEESSDVQAVMYDGAKQTHIDLKLWLETTRLGGGFVYFTLPVTDNFVPVS